MAADTKFANEHLAAFMEAYRPTPTGGAMDFYTTAQIQDMLEPSANGHLSLDEINAYMRESGYKIEYDHERRTTGYTMFRWVEQ